MHILPFRQVHLDFHTSPLMEDLLTEFDINDFVKKLKNAHINSINCFAKCHHGMSYYPTKVGIMHPHLKFDLLGEIIEACHKNGIRVPIYYSVCWDNYMASSHPEWVQCDKEGRLARPPPYEPGWHTLCLNSPYVDYVSAQIEEILKNYEVDGFWFDIVRQIQPGCLCKYCREGIEKLGLDIADEMHLRKFSLMVERKFLERMKNIIHDVQPNATIFFNGQVDLNLRFKKDFFTHIEIESLPTAIWGYHHFPFFVRFCRTIFSEVVGMTARFHRSWGDFGGIKTRDQLEYECATMLANCAKCSIGDQMHPRGRLDKAVYELIGSIYKSVAEKEEWCKGAEPYVEMAILLLKNEKGDLCVNDSNTGAMKILLESKYQFNIIDPWEDFKKYKLLILPDSGIVDEETIKKLDEYLRSGGSLIISHEATLDPTSKKFRCPSIGVEYVGPSAFSPDYIRLGKIISEGIPEMDLIMYERGSYVKPLNGVETLAKISNPYFNRTFRTFTSHAHAPVKDESSYPAIIKYGRVIYVYAPIFKAYYLHGYFVYKRIIENCINILLPERLLRTNAPPSSEATLTRQEGRIIAHIVNYQPQRRGKSSEYIERACPIANVELEVKTEREPRKVYLAPQKIDLEFSFAKGYAKCVIPEIVTHQLVIFELG